MTREKILEAFNRDYPDEFIPEDERENILNDWLLDKIVELYDQRNTESDLAVVRKDIPKPRLFRTLPTYPLWGIQHEQLTHHRIIRHLLFSQNRAAIPCFQTACHRCLPRRYRLRLCQMTHQISSIL